MVERVSFGRYSPRSMPMAGKYTPHVASKLQNANRQTYALEVRSTIAIATIPTPSTSDIMASARHLSWPR